MTVYIEAQHDPVRGTVTITATVGEDRRTIVQPVIDRGAARIAVRDLIAMYRGQGARVVI